MVLVHISAGLGNQMFQYAQYYTFVAKGIPAEIELSAYSTKGERRLYELEEVFGLHPTVASRPRFEYMKIVSKLRLWFFKQPYKETHDQFGTWNPAVKNIRHGYLNGYWQSEKYFVDIQDKIRLQFTFPAITDQRNGDVLQAMKKQTAVSVHIRGGDYLEHDSWTLSAGYYHEAMALMQQKFPGAAFFIFSDDTTWAKKLLGNDHFYIDWNKGADSFRDMQLMSQCNHHIIANSSFSWWGAWLTPSTEKIVIAPDRWIPGFAGTRDIVPTSWIKLKADQ